MNEKNVIDKLINTAEKNNIDDKFKSILNKNYISNRKDTLKTTQNLLKQEIIKENKIDNKAFKTSDKEYSLTKLPFKYIKSTKYGYQSPNKQDIKNLKHKLQALIKNKHNHATNKNQLTEAQEPQSTRNPMGDLEETHYVHEQTLAKLGEDRYEELLMKENPLPPDNTKDNLPF